MLEKTVPGICMAVCLPHPNCKGPPLCRGTILRRVSRVSRLVFVEGNPLVINCGCVSQWYFAHAASGVKRSGVVEGKRPSALAVNRKHAVEGK